MEKRKIIFLILILVTIFAGILGSGFYIYKNILNIDTIYGGVKIDDYDVSQKTKDEAIRYLKEKKEPAIDEKTMKLTYEDKIYNISLRQIGFSFYYEDAVDKAYNLGREGNVLNRLKDIRKIKNKGVTIPLESYYDKDKIENIVSNISQEINKESINAEFHFNNGNIKITEEVIGRRVVTEKLIKSINDNVYTLNDIEIPVDIVAPKVTKDVLGRINGIIGEFSTSFKGSSADRVANIKLSSEAISNKLLLPGEEASFNGLTGPREKQYGYKEANVIVGGELTPGVGGGVCQSSTTLYNALLLADVKIIQRHPHSIPASYVKFGQDAAVAYGYLDLKFRNDFDFPIYLYSKVVGDRVYMYVYGDRTAKDYTVKIEPEIVEIISSKVEEVVDKNLTPGTKELLQKGRTGYKVKTYKAIVKNGKVVKRELITSDYYKQKNSIYRIGP
ncbi:VanW family protein [Tissierella sp. MSJ-40]|uniref:VanW family protein n=1 Tax=Tissierella simiarum TaxID=2841534 RepID=A0ABS6E4L7_9FIRM|nr:VanW family protein [Tissierella simiarum]MBU5437851.1 VanW family protein [Tissierella simiarum]